MTACYFSFLSKDDSTEKITKYTKNNFHFQMFLSVKATLYYSVCIPQHVLKKIKTILVATHWVTFVPQRLLYFLHWIKSNFVMDSCFQKFVVFFMCQDWILKWSEIKFKNRLHRWKEIPRKYSSLILQGRSYVIFLSSP